MATHGRAWSPRGSHGNPWTGVVVQSGRRHGDPWKDVVVLAASGGQCIYLSLELGTLDEPGSSRE
jgi:hypothetical protein